MLGTVRWIESEPSIKAQIDSDSTLYELLDLCDVVITDVFASSVWNEAMAFQKPLILYCNPQQTLLMSHFAHDLERSCYWCKTEEEFVAAVQKLATERTEFARELQQIDTTNFLAQYVLHSNDGGCRQRAVSFIRELCLDG